MAKIMKMYACTRCNWFKYTDENTDLNIKCEYCGGDIYLYKTAKVERILTTYFCKDCFKSVTKQKEEVEDTFCPKCGKKMKFEREHIHKDEDIFPPFDPTKASLYPGATVVECPYCKSINTEKISGLAKAGSVALFGIFSQKVKKQWKCKKCGSEF